MMDLRPIFYVLGLILTSLAGMMIFPLMTDLARGHDNWQAFLLSMSLTAFIGIMMALTQRGTTFELGMRQTFVMTVLTWVTVCLFGALPFFLADTQMTITDSLFESTSGITTTGATVMTGLDNTSRGILLWRSLLQWIGGIGVIVMALSVLPFLKVGGMQLFRTESSENEKSLPRATTLATSTALIYGALTFFCMLGYGMAGMPFFDALCHAMTTLATAGFSTSDSSLGYFQQPDIEMVSILFMLVGSMPFILYVHFVRGNTRMLLHDAQVRAFLKIVATAILLMTAYLVLSRSFPVLTALRLSSFNLISIITGTGYATTDYMAWGPFAVAMFFFLMFAGGCSGSATCGMKVFRLQILVHIVKVQLQKLMYPHGVFIVYYNHRPVPKGVLLSVTSFFVVYVMAFGLSAVALSFTGLDFLTAFSAAASAIANVGPGLGPIVGPTGTFQSLPDTAKWILTASMVLGRLEFFTVLVLFAPGFWKR